MLLRVRDLQAWYGHTQALFGVHFEIAQGETVALVGTNGAGKSTTIRALLGTVASAGVIEFDGLRLQSLKPFERARLGIAVAPEGRGLFWGMTVRENLLLGRGPEGKGTVAEMLDLFPVLEQRVNSRASDLSGGEQQMLSIARAMIRKPRFLMLDEPSLGLAPKLINVVYERLELLKSTGVTILLVEQSIARAAQFAERLCLLRTGEVAATVSTSDKPAVASLVSLALGGRGDERLSRST
jgi:branched-chain amino acid transport system ATP-binding protein